MNQNALIWVAAFALGALAVNSAGIWMIHRHRAWAIRNKEYFMCFAAGMLIASPLLMAFPEALRKNESAGIAALSGFLFMFFSNRYIKYKTRQPDLAFGITAIQGIGIHSLLDGIIYSVTFQVSTMIGLLSGVGMVVHEFAEGVVTYSVLLAGGVSEKKALLYAFLVAGLTTPVGAFIAFPIVSQLSSLHLGLALGFVVGVLIYISASHLLPEVRENEPKHSYIALLAGMSLSAVMMVLK